MNAKDRIPDFNDFMDGFVGSMEGRARVSMRGTEKRDGLEELSLAAMEYGETLGASPFDFAASQAAFKRLQDAAIQFASSGEKA